MNNLGSGVAIFLFQPNCRYWICVCIGGSGSEPLIINSIKQTDKYRGLSFLNFKCIYSWEHDQIPPFHYGTHYSCDTLLLQLNVFTAGSTTRSHLFTTGPTTPPRPSPWTGSSGSSLSPPCFSHFRFDSLKYIFVFCCVHFRMSHCPFPIFCIYLSLFCLQQMVVVSFFKYLLVYLSFFIFVSTISVRSRGKNSLILRKQVYPTVTVQDPGSGAFFWPRDLE